MTAETAGRGDYRRCPNHVRHWFSRYGSPTFRLPRCERCGAPNPKWAEERADMVVAFGEAAVAVLEHEVRNIDGPANG